MAPIENELLEKNDHRAVCTDDDCDYVGEWATYTNALKDQLKHQRVNITHVVIIESKQ